MTALSKPFHLAPHEQDFALKGNVNWDAVVEYINARNDGTTAWDVVSATSLILNGNALTASTQAEQETGSSLTTFVTPGRQHYHTTAAKAWCLFDGTAATPNSTLVGYNVASITDNGVGDYTVNFTTAFSSTSYVAFGSGGTTSGGNSIILVFDRNAGAGTRVARTTTAIRVNTYNFSGGAAADSPTVNVICFGDQ